jgi:hypothetical protein
MRVKQTISVVEFMRGYPVSQSDRREFIQEVSGGMLAVLVGSSLAAELGLAAEDSRDEKVKTTADLTRLSRLIQETPTKDLLPAIATQMKNGTSLRELIAAGALANVRAFGGQDYNGFHSFMALCPSYAMAMALPENERSLPILKVLYRISTHIHGARCVHEDHLVKVEPTRFEEKTPPAEQLREASRARKLAQAEQLFTALPGAPEQIFDDVQLMVQDDLNVHRVVLAWRSWEVLDFIGKDHARDMLRQTVRFCSDGGHRTRDAHPIQTVLPKLLNAHKLLSAKPGSRKVDDGWIERLAKTVYSDKQEKAAETVAAALAERVDPDAVSEAISLAGTMLVLGDPGRKKEWSSPNKPEGSVHGDSVGVHASDAANGWRHIARVASARNTFASLIAAAYHTAGQSGRQLSKPYPLVEDVENVETKDGEKLIAALDEALRGKDQKRAAAVASRYGELGHDVQAIFAKLRQYSISEDGALHAEKYYNTVNEEYGRSREKFRWLHVVALARVAASASGQPAPGVAEARKLLGI